MYYCRSEVVNWSLPLELCMQHANDVQMCAVCDMDQRLKTSDTVVGR